MRGPLHQCTQVWAMPFLLAAFVVLCVAQQPGGSPTVPVVPAGAEPFRELSPELIRKSPQFADLDLMRRNEFSRASAAMVSVRVQDGHGGAVAGLTASDFRLVVNGTPRPLRLRTQGQTALAEHLPVVLLVFPPNQPTVHWIAVRDALQYFGTQSENLPWRVGIFDANGAFFPFTGERKELLRNLAAVQVAKEPLQFTGYRFLPRGESTWQQKAEATIASMARSDGPRVIIAMNPLSESMYGLNETTVDAPIARVSPRDLIAAAELVGAHIYIDNAGGPEPVIPGGAAADQAPLRPSYLSANRLISLQQMRALHYLAYTNSLMMQTAQETMGGYANTFKELGGQIERDLRQAYVLEFDLTPQDQDRGTPEVEVSSPVHQIHLAMVDVAPLRVAAVPQMSVASRAVGSAVLNAMRKLNKPVLSPDFRIHQRVDYFPVRGGATPVLPMTGMVEWTGTGTRPEQLAVAEAVIDLDLATPALQREIDTVWQSRSVRWERDGELRPGHYAWLVAVHDARGTILSSARETFTVAYQGGAAVSVSTLVTGATCQDAPEPSGLQRRPPRTAVELVSLIVDPLRLSSCRLIPEAADRFTTLDTLRALVRIYPAGKLAKLPPEAWTASYILKRDTGTVEVQKTLAFALDAGSGLLAAIDVVLSADGVQPGEHILDVEVRGPGIRHVLKEQQKLSIAVAAQVAGSTSR